MAYSFIITFKSRHAHACKRTDGVVAQSVATTIVFVVNTFIHVCNVLKIQLWKYPLASVHRIISSNQLWNNRSNVYTQNNATQYQYRIAHAAYYSTTQHRTHTHSTEEHSTTQHWKQHSTEQQRTIQHITHHNTRIAQCTTAVQHSTAQHSIVQYSPVHIISYQNTVQYNT